jgi:hypothetical protein
MSLPTPTPTGLITDERDRERVRDYLHGLLEAERRRIDTLDFAQWCQAQAKFELLIEMYVPLLGEMRRT